MIKDNHLSTLKNNRSQASMEHSKRFKQQNSDLHALMGSSEQKKKSGGTNSLENSKSAVEYQKLQ